MEPFEIMVSESQERMLCVCTADNAAAVLAVCEKWEVGGTVIGQVTDTRHMRIFRGERLVGDMPVTALVDDCPLYDLAPAAPATALYPPPAATLPEGGRPAARADRARRTCLAPAAVRAVRLPRAARAPCGGPSRPTPPCWCSRNGASIGVSIDGNGRRVAADPYTGTVEAVLECAANLACVGAEPLGLTNCLNFGNPEKPHIAWQLTESVRGLGDACRALGVPVVGGNVSLYNEGGEGPIYPTPVVGMVGELPDAVAGGRAGVRRRRATPSLSSRVGEPSLAAGELAKLRGEPLPVGLAAVDIAAVGALHAAVRDAVRAAGSRLVPRRRRGRSGRRAGRVCLAGGARREGRRAARR